MNPNNPQSEQTGDVHISEYLAIIMSRRRIFLSILLAVFLATAIHTFRIKPVFEAFATLQVQTPKGGKGDLRAELGGNVQNPIDTEIEIIKSRTMAEQVIRRMQRPPLSGMPDTSGLTSDALQNAANGLKGGILAMEVGNKTGIIRLSYQSTDPIQARDVVNTLAKAYQEHNLAFKSQEASKTMEFIEKQLVTTKNDLDEAEKNLQAFKSGSGAVKLDANSTELFKRLADFDGQLSTIGLQKKQLEFAAASLREAIRKGAVHTQVAGLKDDAVTGALAGRLAELDVQRRALLSELSEGHPQVKALKAQIDELQAKLLATYEATLKGLGRHETGLKQELGRYEGQFRKLPEAERGLARLLRLTKVNADIYILLLQKHEESRLTKAATISNISVVDPAITPTTPIKPNKKKNLIIGLLVGLMLAVGVTLFIEYLDDTIKDAESARRELGAPVLAVIPFIARKEGEAASRQSSLVTLLEPKSSVSEAFRALRTSLHFSAINREKKVILMTSTFPGEGKTTVIANLAVTLMQTGARVLLLDGDMRRPALHEIFGHSKLPGLSEILAGDTSFESVLHDTGIEGLDLISAGTVPPNPSELLGSEQMANLLATLRDHYDHVLIDAPPVLAVTDAPLLTARCDVVLVTLETERVPVKAGRRMAEMLVNVQAPVAGIVVNDKSDHSRERYGYYGNYYGYGYYGEDDKAAKKVKPWWRRILKF